LFEAGIEIGSDLLGGFFYLAKARRNLI